MAKNNFWKDILAIGALAFLGSQLDNAIEKSEDLEAERDELQSKMDAAEEKYGIDFEDEYDPDCDPELV